MTDRAAFIQRINDPPQEAAKVLTVLECKEYITQKNTDLVSFEGTIRRKIFADPPTQKVDRKVPYGFGTTGTFPFFVYFFLYYFFLLIGLRTHQLVFTYFKNGKENYLDLYLLEWYSVMPLGLIPEMKIRVHNVIPHGNKFLITCLFTNFEFVSYEPVVEFDTVNL